MNFNFFKYQGTGNDFVIIDDPKVDITRLTVKERAFICSRKYGVGGDGLIWLKPSEEHDFEMIYYNADGEVSSMCGNGGRCSAFHFMRYMSKKSITQIFFLAVDGTHKASLLDGNEVSLKMQDAIIEQSSEQYFVVQTGSPHYVKWVDQNVFEIVDFVSQASRIRRSPEFNKEGINVNFININATRLNVRTFERGVEDETDSCGTGVVACAISAYYSNVEHNLKTPIQLITKGGTLSVSWSERSGEKIANVYLNGPVKMVFKGSLTL